MLGVKTAKLTEPNQGRKIWEEVRQEDIGTAGQKGDMRTIKLGKIPRGDG